MNEQFVTLDVARLAKEKGFKEPCLAYFSISGEEKYFREDGMYFYSIGAGGRLILRPFQSLLQKWLREKKFYHIYVMPVTGNKWVYNVKYISLVIGDFIPCLLIEQEYNTYEEALEHGLLEALKLIS